MISLNYLESYLNKYPDNKKLILVSFFVTDKKVMKNLKELWSSRDASHSKVFKKNDLLLKRLNVENFGGSIVLLDPLNLNKGFISEIKTNLAFGMCVSPQKTSLFVTGGNVIYEIQNRKHKKTISNSLFNDLHGLSLSRSSNLLVVSTGTDSILEIKIGGKSRLLWDWFATENGFEFTATGKKRFIDRTSNYQNISTTTPEHTTHINNAICYDGKIFATLFHQGKLIEIDRKSKKFNVILSGLKQPHNFRVRVNGFMICNTRANEVLLLDSKYNVTEVLRSNFDWVQDALEVEYDKFLIADSNNNRLVLVNRNSQVLSLMDWEKDSRKISSFEIVSKQEAKNIFLL